MTEKEKLSVLREQLAVMKIKIEERNRVQEKMTNRMFTLFGAELAITGLLSSSFIGIPLPVSNAGLIFLYLAVGLIILSFGILMYSYRTTKNWPSPMSEAEVNLMNAARSEAEALQVLYEDYRLCYRQQGGLIDPKARMLNTSLTLFVISTIILLILKFGG